MRQRAEVVNRALAERLETVLPKAMREAGIDMWLVICQEDNLDPVYESMIPMDTWCPILQILVFYDRGPEAGIERINFSMTDTKDLYEKPWLGRRHHSEQWTLLRGIVEESDPQRIGINVGQVQWAAGGLTHNLYNQLVEALPLPEWDGNSLRFALEEDVVFTASGCRLMGERQNGFFLV